MITNRGDIRTHVREVSLVETDDWADASLDDIINMGLFEVCAAFDWPFLATTSTIDLVADQQAYDLPSDLLRLARIVVVGTQIELKEISAQKAWNLYGDSYSSGARPTHFYIWGDEVFLIPIPSDSTEDIKFWYFAKPTALTDDTHVPPWDSSFNWLLAEYVMWKVWQREEDYQKADVHRMRHSQGVESMAAFYLNRHDDHPFVLGDGLHASARFPQMPWLETT